MEDKNLNSRDHLANERTFLAWIRTSIAIIAFGFVIEKFSLFMKQLSFILGKGVGETLPSSPGYSALVGILLVAFGTMLSVLGLFKFKKNQKQIDQGKYQTSSLLEVILTLIIFVVGSFLVVFLIKSVS